MTREQYIDNLVERYERIGKNANIAQIIYADYIMRRYPWLTSQSEREELYKDFIRRCDHA